MWWNLFGANTVRQRFGLDCSAGKHVYLGARLPECHWVYSLDRLGDEVRLHPLWKWGLRGLGLLSIFTWK